MTILASISPGVPFIYEGAPFHARGLALAAEYRSSWQPPQDGIWEEHRYVPRCWVHRHYPRHLVWTPEDNVLGVAQLASSTPTAASVLQLGRLALGPSAVPFSVVSFPLALRLPMRATDAFCLALPSGNFRCPRLWPLSGELAHLEHIDLDDAHKLLVELRISGTRGKNGVRFYAEAFVGRAHETWTKLPRALIFSGDARHVVLAPGANRVKRSMARLMDALLAFAYLRQDQGLEVDHRALRGRQLGRAQMSTTHPGDVEFAIHLPQPGGTQGYVGSWFSP